MTDKKLISVLSILVLAVWFLPADKVQADALSKGYINSEGNWVESIEQKQQRINWFKEAKLGLMVHWGLYSVPAGEYKDKTLRRNSEWIQRDYRIPNEEYNKFAENFNPSGFDAEQWVKLAKESGIKYIIFVAKHFDGFAMYDSKISDYDVVDATALGRDPVKDLAAACKKHGIKLGFSYSLLRDWHEPDAIGNFWDYPENFTDKRYPMQERGRKGIESYIKRKAIRQIEELLTNYQPDIMVYINKHDMTREQADDFINVIRKNQPDCIVNKIFWRGPEDVGIGDIDNGFPLISSYEVRMPEEWIFTSRMSNSWGYLKNRKWREVEVLLPNMVDVVSKNGIFLLNVGADANGVIPEQAAQRLLKIGQWMDVNGESIYGAQASPFREFGWGRCTVKPGKLFFHIFSRPENGQIEISGLNNKIEKIYLLASGESLNYNQRTDGILTIDVPAEAMEQYVTVVAAEIDSPLDVDFFPVKLVRQDVQGNINCTATKATINVDGDGRKAVVNTKEEAIVNWQDIRCYLTWSFLTVKAGNYNVEFTYSCRANNNNKCSVEVAGKTLVTDTPSTDLWSNYKTINLGQVAVNEAGEHVITLRYLNPKIRPVNVKGIRLVPIENKIVNN